MYWHTALQNSSCESSGRERNTAAPSARFGSAFSSRSREPSSDDGSPIASPWYSTEASRYGVGPSRSSTTRKRAMPFSTRL